ncbi:hypothetical protein TWF192_007773 [Orbilia oligospora]|nr:hypothetical protein TWF192_007773 [Orbilia oligospora]
MDASLSTERWSWSSNAKDIGMCARNLKAIIEDSGYNGSLKAKSHSHKEIQVNYEESVQKSKTEKPALNPNSEQNDDDEEPEERSASKLMRRRSHRSSLKPEKVKSGKAKDDSRVTIAKTQRTRNMSKGTTNETLDGIKYE